jgi:4-hydroxy-2-oxoheptanedioate aldolase
MKNMMIKPRPSRILRRMRAGETVLVHKAVLSDPKGIELAGFCGVDCVWLDTEHGGLDYSVLENLVRAAKLHDMDSLVRVRKGSYSDLLNPLEADATGIMVPHVVGADEAREIVRTTRFQPIGRRALDGGTADGAFTMIPLHEYLEHSNNERFVILQIEDPEALDHVEEMAAVPGYDMLLLGPGDLSHGLGAPGQIDHPRINAIRQSLPGIAHANGKFAGTTGGIDDIAKLVELGYDLVAVSSDIGPIIGSCRHAVARLEAANNPEDAAAAGAAREEPEPQEAVR